MISMRAVSVKGREGRAVLAEVNLEIGSGERHALIGPSGAGKTTIALAAIGALPPGLEDTGTVLLFGRDLHDLGDRARRRLRLGRVALLGQDPGSTLTPTRTVRQLVAESGGHIDAAAALNEVGLRGDAAFLRCYPWELSGGQQRRVALARALAAQPQLLIVDEPTAGLDPASKRTVIDLIDQVVRARSLTLLVISHDHGTIAALGCRVHQVRAGSIDALHSAGTRVDRGVPTSAKMTPSAKVALRARALSAAVMSRGRRSSVLSGVDLDLRHGSLTAISGESGSGKSTLLRMLVGLHIPESGRIELNGETLDPSLHRRTIAERRRIQLVHQDAVGSLNPRITVGSSVRRAMTAGSASAATLELHRLLDAVGLPFDIAHRLPRELSGGQRQRIILCRALAADPEVLLCDEITTALNPELQNQVIEMLATRARSGLTVALVTHEPALIARCSQALRVDDGRVV